jgi:hypothetical protein
MAGALLRAPARSNTRELIAPPALRPTLRHSPSLKWDTTSLPPSSMQVTRASSTKRPRCMCAGMRLTVGSGSIRRRRLRLGTDHRA